MPRRNHRVHRKGNVARRAPEVEVARAWTPEHMAYRLVSRGLASAQILESTKPPADLPRGNRDD